MSGSFWRIVVGASLLLAFSPAVHAAVTVDIVSTGTFNSSPVTVSHETSGATRFMMVCSAQKLDGSSGQMSGVTYDTVPLTLTGRRVDPEGDVRVDCFELTAPNTGIHDVVASFTSLPSGGMIGVITFNGVDQITPRGSWFSTGGSGSTASVNVTSAVGELVYGVVGGKYSGTVSPGAGQTEWWDLSNGGGTGGASTEPGAASVTTSFGVSNKWAVGSVSIKPDSSISGTVFEDANFAGAALPYDGGAVDKPLQGVDVELYNGGTDAYITSVATVADGSFYFGGLADGSYKVRVRSATIGTGTATPKGGLNGTVPGTWPNPLAEMIWGNGAFLYGGQSATADDTATGDNAGPGDTHVPVTKSGASLTGVDFGFAYNVIVNTTEDSNADNARSAQGSLRQFIKNSNAIGSAGSTTANSSEFRIPTSDPNYNVGTGVFTITPPILLPAMADNVTTLDASTQGDNTSQTNAGNLGVGGKVGTRQLDLSTVPAPEIQIVNNETLSYGLRFTGSSGVLRGIAIYGFGTGSTGEGNVFVADATTGQLIEQNLVGSPADDFQDPGSGFRGWENVYSDGADDGTIQNNLIGFGGIRGILIARTSLNWTIQDNEIRDSSLEDPFGDGLAIDPGQATVIGNLIYGSGSQGVVLKGSTGSTFTDNRIERNGIGTDSASGNAAGMTFRSTALGHIVEFNEFIDNYGAGLSVNDGATGIKITQNSFSDNGTIAARNLDPKTDQIGIDLNNPTDDSSAGTFPFYSLNDPGDSGGNNILNFPILETALINGPNLEIEGWAPANSVVEVFLRDTDPTLLGEGLTYVFTVTENGTGAGLEDTQVDLETGPATAYGPGAINGVAQGADTENRFRFVFTKPPLISESSELTATARDGSNNTSEFGGQVTVARAPADLTLAKTGNPDPAALGGALLYNLLITNNGPGIATNVTLTDTLPASVTLQSATPSQGSCSGTTTVTCNLGAIVATGTASIEILVVTTAIGTVTNNASVTATETDPVPADNAVSVDTDVVLTTAISDLPLTQFRRIHGFLDYTVTGGSLRTSDQGNQACNVATDSTQPLSGVPAGATVRAAYLYWGGSGTSVDDQVTFGGASITADRTFTGTFTQGSKVYDFFGGVEDVTAQIELSRNGNYTFENLTVETGNPYCSARAVVAGWSLFVVYEETGLSGKTLVLYDGFDISRQSSTSYQLSGIWAADPPEAKTTLVVWEGDAGLTGSSEMLEFNGVGLSDGDNPADNVYNSTINSLGVTDSFGVDLDTYDVSSLVSEGDTLATTFVSVGPDLIILNAVVLQAKSNIIVGSAFEDVNYGGGNGRGLAAAVADAPTFTVPRPSATVELYDNGGNFLRTTTTDANGRYGFAGIDDGDYQVRVVNESVGSSRPGAGGTEWPVQTYRTDASTGTAAAVAGEIGGATPQGQDSAANVALANLGTLTAQSASPVKITTGVAVLDVDFGYNFDTIVNTNDGGQGSLEQFILNSNNLTNANLDQNGLTAGVETSLFMIPSDTDPWGRTQDANFDAGRGVATIRPATGRLPAISDAATALDGTTQTTLIGDTNSGSAGNPELAGTTVGTGADGVESTGDEVTLPSYLQPEIEIDGNDQGIVLEVAADNTVVTGVSVFNAPSAPTGILVSAGTGSLITANLIGPDADGVDPGSGSRLDHAVEIIGGAADVTNNYVAFTENSGIILEDDSVVSGNDIYLASLGNPTGDGISVENSSGTITVRENRVDKPAAYGFESWNASGPWTIEDNSFSRSGQGGGVENGGVRIFGTGSTVRHNIVTGSAGAGVMLVQRNTPGSNLQNLISQNAIYGNGGPGIDLDVTNTGLVNPNGDGVTANDGAVDGNLPNTVLDYPVVASARLSGATLSVEGYVGTAASKIAGVHTLEFFVADDDGNNDGEVESGDALSVPHGEGRWYIDSCVSAADGTFDCDLAVPLTVTLSVGDEIAGTTLDASSNTSEFSANATVFSPVSMVKRAFQLDGTPIASGSTLPSGTPVRFLIYIDNPSGAVIDSSLQDALDPLFAYQAGSIKVSNALVSSVVCPAGVCDEAAIFAAADTGTGATDAVDADVVGLSGVTIHAGDGTVANARLDLAGDRVWALVFTVVIQ